MQIQSMSIALYKAYNLDTSLAIHILSICTFINNIFCYNYKHQWNTRWAFTQKLDIFTCENNILSSHVKISLLLWLHNKSCLSHQKNYLSEMVWYFIGVYITNKTSHGRLGIRNFSSWVEKIFHSFTALSGEIVFNTQRETSYLRVAM